MVVTFCLISSVSITLFKDAVEGEVVVMVITFCLMFVSITLFKDAVEGEIVVMVVTFCLMFLSVSSHPV